MRNQKKTSRITGQQAYPFQEMVNGKDIYNYGKNPMVSSQWVEFFDTGTGNRFRINCGSHLLESLFLDDYRISFPAESVYDAPYTWSDIGTMDVDPKNWKLSIREKPDINSLDYSERLVVCRCENGMFAWDVDYHKTLFTSEYDVPYYLIGYDPDQMKGTWQSNLYETGHVEGYVKYELNSVSFQGITLASMDYGFDNPISVMRFNFNLTQQLQ